MRLLASMRSDVPGLMFQTVKGSITKGTFITSGRLLPVATHILSFIQYRKQEACGSDHLGIELGDVHLQAGSPRVFLP
jgi:hypothetical protein